MRVRSLLLWMPLWLCALAVPATATDGAGPPDPALAKRLDAVLGSRALRGAQVGALVVRSRDGVELYARDADRAFTPASNQKILTAIAVLDAYGPTHRFETRIYAAAPPDAEGTVEDLVVVGGGDPALNNEDWWRLASRLRRAGVRRVRGDLVVDDAAFDRERWHPSWGKTSSRAYHAPVGALTANYGAFAVTVTPGARAGDPVAVTIDPPVDYFEVSNRARTGTARSRRYVSVDRSARSGGELVTIKGTLPAGGEPRTYYRSVLDPARYAGAVLRMQLAANGIAVDGGVREGAVPDDASLILAFEGRPLSEVVRLFMKYSNNATAETLVKGLALHASTNGAASIDEHASAAPQAPRASWPAGVRELEKRLVGLGLDSSGWTIVDGSGLSYENKVSPRTLVEALRRARASFLIGPELEAALPIASRDGTLEERAEGAGGAVRAKTGLLTRVTALSGYAMLADGERVVFSVMVNGYRVGDRAAMDAVDRFVAELVGKPAAERRPARSEP